MKKLKKGTRLFFRGNLHQLPTAGTITGLIKNQYVSYIVKFDDERYPGDNCIARVLHNEINCGSESKYISFFDNCDQSLAFVEAMKIAETIPAGCYRRVKIGNEPSNFGGANIKGRKLIVADSLEDMPFAELVLEKMGAVAIEMN